MSATRKPSSRSSNKKKSNGNGFSSAGLEVEDIAELARRIPELDDEEKRTLIRQLRPQRAKRLSEIEKEQQQRAVVKAPRAPSNDDELWEWIRDNTGYEIPRVAVCDDHTPPFKFIADCYFNRVDAALVLGSRESGKCLPGDALIYDPQSGERVRLDEVVDGRLDRILTMTEDGRVIEAPITFRWNTGIKECFRVCTLSGREVEVTPEHPFMTTRGWVRCDELEDSECIAIPSRLPMPTAPSAIPEAHVDLLAVLLAEGTYTQDTVGFSTDSQAIWRIMHDATEALSCDIKYRGGYDYGIVKRSGLRNPVREMLDSYGIGREKAKVKRLPEVVFGLPREQLQRFLSIFWMCDGYVMVKKAPEITLASKQMLEQIQHLLLRFGVQAKLSYKASRCEGKIFDAWRLTVYGNCIPQFAEAVPFLWGEKRDRLQVHLSKRRCPSSGRPPLTPEMLDEIRFRFPPRSRGPESTRRTREARKMLGWKESPGTKRKTATMGPSVLLAGKVLNLQARRLRALCHAHGVDESEYALWLSEDLWWDPVVSIESVGEKEVYDLTMFPTSSFVANDFIVHNTLGVSILHYANAETKPGCEGCTFAVVQAQSERAYKHVKSFIYVRDENGRRVPKPQIDGDPTRKKTEWKTGSVIEIIIGTVAGVNSPHPHVVHADEVDIMEEEVWEQSRNMAQPLDSMVVVPSGWATIGDLQVGDPIVGLDGKRHFVLATYDLGEQPVYRVELTDGRVTECAAGHKWLVGSKSGSGRRWSVKTIDDLLADYLRAIDGRTLYRYCLPMPSPVEYDHADELPLDPYVLGVLLGDGCIRRRLANFRADDPEIVQIVNARLPDGVGVHTSLHADGAANHRITRGQAGKAATTANPVVTALEELGLEGCGSHEKFIPDIYMFASREARLELLRGLMDTDGSFSKDPYFASVSMFLARDVARLVRSLGGRAIRRRKSTSTSSFRNCGYIYEVAVHLPNGVNPFRCSHKAQKFVGRTRTLMPYIRKITSVGVKPVRCITVSAEDGIYLTDMFIPTHNSSSGKGTNGNFIPALDVATSTRKSMRGLMQKLINRITEAKKKGHRPPFEFYAYCFAETAAEVPSCRCADPIERVHRLIHLGMDARELCECNKVVNGEWRENVDRTLESVCRGRLFKSRGWMPYADISRKFMQQTQTVWDAEMECRRPAADGLYLENFTRQRYTVRGWIPRPEYGRIVVGVDWGGAANSVVVWIQGPLNHPVEIPGFDGQLVVVPQNAYVVFDQIEAARTGATRLADLVCGREQAWKAQFPNWRVRGRFADMAGAQQRADWAEHSPPLRTQWYISRDFDPTVDAIQGLVDNGLLYVDVTRCSSLCDDFESWRSKDGREVHDDATHGPAASRYALANVIVLERREGRKQTSKALPVVRERAALDNGAMAAIASSGPTSVGQVETEAWRRAYGMSGSGSPGVNDWQNFGGAV